MAYRRNGTQLRRTHVGKQRLLVASGSVGFNTHTGICESDCKAVVLEHAKIDIRAEVSVSKTRHNDTYGPIDLRKF
jgi:hypothetical protein